MSEKVLTPFEQAEENIKHFVETADMMQSLNKLKDIMDSVDSLSGFEKETVSIVVETTMKSLSQFLEKRGDEWN